MKIVLMIDWLKPRALKIDNALRKKGMEVAILINELNKEDLKRNPDFHKRVKCFNPYDFSAVIEMAKKEQADVYHILCGAYIEEWVEHIIGSKAILGRVVFDQYDSYRDFVNTSKDTFSCREKFCIENADGLCNRNYEISYLKEKYNYRINAEILFFDYCWGDFDDIKKTDNSDDDRLKLVYGGRLLARNLLGDEYFVLLYKIERLGFRFLAEIMERFGGVFVIVPTAETTDPEYSEYRNLHRLYPGTRIEKSMGARELIEFESRMDYGVDCVDLECVMQKYEVSLEGMRREHTFYATNKFFDYLDAGIMPLYGRDYEMFGKTLEKNGAAIYCPLDQMVDELPILKESRKSNKKRAREARAFYAIDRQIDRLIDFYSQL